MSHHISFIYRYIQFFAVHSIEINQLISIHMRMARNCFDCAHNIIMVFFSLYSLERNKNVFIQKWISMNMLLCLNPRSNSVSWNFFMETTPIKCRNKSIFEMIKGANIVIAFFFIGIFQKEKKLKIFRTF